MATSDNVVATILSRHKKRALALIICLLVKDEIIPIISTLSGLRVCKNLLEI